MSPVAVSPIVPGTGIQLQQVPYACNASACDFPEMPRYNQANPNFAFVDVPLSIYSAEQYKVTGKLVWDKEFKHYAVELKNGKLDPFYASWLPYGPLTGDDHSLNSQATAICGPTSTSMVLMAQLAAKSATTQVKPGSWTEVSFLQAKKPADQDPIPTPLQHDHNTLNGSQQMTAAEIQRVVNVADLDKTDPTHGTYGGLMNAFNQVREDLRYSGGGAHEVVKIDDGTQPVTIGFLTGLVKQRWSAVVGGAPYIAHVKQAGFAGEVVEFEQNGGHYLALNGFEGSASDPTFLIYDPVHANVLHVKLREIASTGKNKKGDAVSAKLPNNRKSILILPDSSRGWASVGSLGEIVDGQTFFFLDEYHAIRIE
jgi:hypothetical protein